MNNLLAYNAASLGGGIYSYDQQTQIIHVINNTITENEAEENGGGIYLWGSNAIIMNTILWNDFAIFNSEVATIDSELDVVYSNFDGGWPGEGNIDEDPEFVDDTLFHISWDDSPCWDAGIDQVEVDGVVYYAPDHDLEGEVRPGDAGVDIGADEDIMYIGTNELQVAGCRLQVFPNPAWGISKIKYQISESKSVLIQVYDIHGTVVCTLLNENQSSGEHSVHFDISSLPAGIYLIRLQAGKIEVTQKLVLIQ
jgi:parallel beta-helix repeat protein